MDSEYGLMVACELQLISFWYQESGSSAKNVAEMVSSMCSCVSLIYNRNIVCLLEY